MLPDRFSERLVVGHAHCIESSHVQACSTEAAESRSKMTAWQQMSVTRAPPFVLCTPLGLETELSSAEWLVSNAAIHLFPLISLVFVSVALSMVSEPLVGVA